MQAMSALEDSLIVELTQLSGDYLMLNWCSFQDSGVAVYNLFANDSLPQIPSLELYTQGLGPATYGFSQSGRQYIATVADPLGKEGLFSVVGLDDSSHQFFVNSGYTVAWPNVLPRPAEIYGPGGNCALSIDRLDTLMQKLLILSSDFPPMMEGLEIDAERGGQVHSVCSYPEQGGLLGENYITIRYALDDLENTSQDSLQVFRWNSVSQQWELIGGEVDTINNEIVAQITTLGTYAAFSTSTTDVPDEPEWQSRPSDFSVSQNYPNPFNPITTIEYSLPKDCHTEITIYNLLGHKVKVLVNEQQRVGHHTATWDGTDKEGDEVASGIYFYRIEADEFSQSKKMLLLK
jgi:hypothetical protein